MDIDKYKSKNTNKAILKLRDKDPITDSKIKGWSTVHGTLSDGNEVFASFPDDELRKCPEKNGYVDLSSVAVVRLNKADKMYLDPIIAKPARNVGFQNPWDTPDSEKK